MDCDIDHLGQIQPSGLWCEELLHFAALTADHKSYPNQSEREESRGDA